MSVSDRRFTGAAGPGEQRRRIDWRLRPAGSDFKVSEVWLWTYSDPGTAFATRSSTATLSDGSPTGINRWSITTSLMTSRRPQFELHRNSRRHRYARTRSSTALNNCRHLVPHWHKRVRSGMRTTSGPTARIPSAYSCRHQQVAITFGAFNAQ